MLIKSEDEPILYIYPGNDNDIYLNIIDNSLDYHFSLSEEDAIKLINTLTQTLLQLDQAKTCP